MTDIYDFQVYIYNEIFVLSEINISHLKLFKQELGVFP